MSTATITPGTRRLANLPPLTPKQLRDADRDQLYIFNTAPREHRTTICGRTWTIPACPEGQDVSAPLVIPGAVYYTDVKKVHGIEVEFQWMTVDGVDLAQDIVGTSAFRHESENLIRWGVFIADSPHPAPRAIENARQHWYDRCDEKVREADDAYALNGGRVDLGGGRSASNIGPDNLEAARVLGVEDQKLWARKNLKQVPCDECGTGNLPTAAFCKQCDNLLNEEAAKRKFPAKYAERMGAAEPAPELPKRAPARPRAEA